MTNAVTAVRQSMQKEAPDELADVERHRPRPVAMSIVAPAKRHLATRHADHAGIGDGDAMGIAAQIGQHLLWSAERRLGIDDPVAALGRGQTLGESLRVGQFCEISEEAQVFCRECGAQRLQKQLPEQARQNPDRQAIQRVPSGDRPPPGTMQWRCGW